jgi:NHLM bacteriocin system ABC transporter peptidase/ATP-binding protein
MPASPTKTKEAPRQASRFSAARHRTPTVLQMEATECGAAALGSVLAYHGRWVSLEQLRVECAVSRDGARARHIVDAARRFGVTARGMRAETIHLSDLPMPLIAFWNFDHFVVIEGAGPKGVWVNDPAGGPRLVGWGEFDLAYTGVVIVIETPPDFESGGAPPSLFRALGSRLHRAGATLVLCLLAGLALVVPGLVVAVAMRVFVDRATAGLGGGAGIAPTLGVILLAAAVVAAALTWLQQSALVRLSAQLSISMSTTFMEHLLRLPVPFFQQRYAGALVTRTDVNDEVAQLLSSQFASAMLQGITVIFYAVLMYVYSPVLATVSVGSALINLVVLRAAARRRRDANRRLVLDRSKMVAAAMGGLRNIETIKAIGEESGLFNRWAGLQAKVTNARQELGLPTLIVNAMPETLAALNTLFIIGFGGWQVMRGSLSLGTLVAFEALSASFAAPIYLLVGLGATVQEMSGKLASVDDVLNHPEDVGLASREAAAVADPSLFPALMKGRLSGLVELRNLTFGFDPSSPPLIEDFSLVIRPGQRVALVGSSGSGKSTVARLVCGLIAPWSGEILFDGIPRQDVPRPVLAASVTLVDQDILLFEGSISDNLSLWDPTIPSPRLTAAARDAGIHRDVLARTGGYDRVLEEAGRDWSGGQRQRLEIARALGTDPSVVVLDEATSALDALIEAEIDRNLRARGCSCLIVAHRLSTIRDADEIVVMDGGRIVERGRHEELLLAGGSYAALVSE